MAQPKSTSTIQSALEAINLLDEAEMFWLGGGQHSQESGVIMSQNYPANYPNNYDEVNFVVSSLSKHSLTIFDLGAGMAAASSKWILTVGF